MGWKTGRRPRQGRDKAAMGLASCRQIYLSFIVCGLVWLRSRPSVSRNMLLSA
jgi:hypothetical protein